ncbi:MAG TPA: PAC2 family protein [Microbacteriaceae bacterium]|nr:PAC2 family protein [Microbacteriaceae bacterium]
MSQSTPPGFSSGRILIVAFEGWNDAGEAATQAVRTIAASCDLSLRFAVDPERYYDYQFNRPTVGFDENGRRVISWPGAELFGPEPGDSTASLHAMGAGADGLHVLLGSEPARTWQGFAAEIIDAALAADIDGIVFFGAMLADAPHTRPLTVYASTDSIELQRELGLEASSYEGPVGIVSVLAHAAAEAGIPSFSLWAAVPHYVHTPPSPKAALALIRRFEDLTGIAIPVGNLELEADTWVASVDSLAESDEDMARYIEQLETARDAMESMEASADSIAEEFERYLRRTDDKGGDEPRHPRSDS